MKWDEELLARGRLLALRISWQDWIETVKSVLWLVASLFAAVSILWYLYHDRGGIAWLREFLKRRGGSEAAAKTLSIIGGAGGTVAALLLFLNQLRELFKSPASLDKTARLFGKPDYSGKLPLIHQ